MWSSQKAQASDSKTIKLAIELDSSPVSYADVIQRWQHDAGFRSYFIGLLSDCPFPALRWETPPVTTKNVDQPFEFVMLDSPYLACIPDASDFAEYFVNKEPGEVVVFPNLGRDAILVAPCPDGPNSNFGHLAAFLKHSSAAQQHLLWERVGQAMEHRLGHNPVWLSTAGGGVDWLHVRLDDRPKYYGYAPYRRANP